MVQDPDNSEGEPVEKKPDINLGNILNPPK